MTVSQHRRSAAAGLTAAALLGVAVALAGVPPPTAGAATGMPAGGAGGATAGGTGGWAVPGRALPARPDRVRTDQWQLDALRAATAWQHARGRGVVVGVLDSGVDATHKDLVGQVLPGLDLVAGSGDGRRDPVGHGTTVAGLIAGRGDDETGVVGLAPEARILPVRVLDVDNRYEDAMVIAKGVRWAVDRGARVINLSLGGVGESAALAEALDYAFAKDVVVIACTGNVTQSTPSDVWYPAREPGVVAVSGLDRTEAGRLWANSVTGRATVLSAPATGLVGARPGGYWRVQGTSFAAPLVTATAALIRSRWPTLSAANVVNRLVRTARDVGPPGRDASFGFGAVDPVAALTRSLPPVEANPLDTAPPPGHAGFGAAPGVAEVPAGGRLTGRPLSGAPHHAGGGAESLARDDPPADSGAGLLGGVAIVVVLVTGGVLAVRRLDRSAP